MFLTNPAWLLVLVLPRDNTKALKSVFNPNALPYIVHKNTPNSSEFQDNALSVQVQERFLFFFFLLFSSNIHENKNKIVFISLVFTLKVPHHTKFTSSVPTICACSLQLNSREMGKDYLLLFFILLCFFFKYLLNQPFWFPAISDVTKGRCNWLASLPDRLLLCLYS